MGYSWISTHIGTDHQGNDMYRVEAYGGSADIRHLPGDSLPVVEEEAARMLFVQEHRYGRRQKALGPFEQMVLIDLKDQKDFVADSAGQIVTESEMVDALGAAFPATSVNQKNMVSYYIVGLWADGWFDSPTYEDFRSWVIEVGPQTVKDL